MVDYFTIDYFYITFSETSQVSSQKRIIMDIEHHEKTWSIELLKIVPKLFSTSTCLHVFLLVFLRRAAIVHPTSYKKTSAFQQRYKLTIAIWVISTSLCLFPIIARYFDNQHLHEFINYLLLHGFHTLPVALIIGMYVNVSWTIKRHQIPNPTARKISVSYLYGSGTDKNKKRRKPKASEIIKRVIVCLVLCYFPYIVCWQYVTAIMMKRNPLHAHNSEVSSHIKHT